MKERNEKPMDPNDRLAPKLYGDLGKLGWRTPQSEPEVRAAEGWAGKAPGELPNGLRDVPHLSHSADSPSEGILSRYLAENDGISDSRSEAGGRDNKQRDQERE